tara:strand:- start:52643 stop:53086 length:444 start_codon:yes stop_codon:yes gene_type:complete
MTTTTFAEYAESAEARKQIEEAVLAHTLALCEALRQNYLDYSIRMHKLNIGADGDSTGYHAECIDKLEKGISEYDFVIDTGRKYHKVIMVNNQRSTHAFVDKRTGEVYKAASWKSPAKGVRFDLRLIEQREWLFKNADWAGGYLYAR